MFYVIYSPSTNGYLNIDGELGTFEHAERYSVASRNRLGEVLLQNAKLYAPNDIRWVGPCEEG